MKPMQPWKSAFLHTLDGVADHIQDMSDEDVVHLAARFAVVFCEVRKIDRSRVSSMIEAWTPELDEEKWKS
jgi:hypothetical protein